MESLGEDTSTEKLGRWLQRMYHDGDAAEMEGNKWPRAALDRSVQPGHLSSTGF